MAAELGRVTVRQGRRELCLFIDAVQLRSVAKQRSTPHNNVQFENRTINCTCDTFVFV